MWRFGLSVGLLLAACSRDRVHETSASAQPVSAQAAVPASSSENAGDASTQIVRSDDDVCAVLTPEEVAAELEQPVRAKILPRSGRYSAPSCGWFASDTSDTSDAPSSAKLTVTLFLISTDGPKRFAEKLESVCRDDQMKVENLGDEAARCGLLWVRKGNVYFSVGPRNASGTWPATTERLARRVLTRLP